MVQVIGRKRDGSVRTRTKNGVVTAEETYNYIVTADYAAQPGMQVQTGAGILPGQMIAPSGFTKLQAASGTQRTENPLYWDFTLQFSSDVEENSEDPTSDPTTWVPVYETKFERLQENVATDRDGDAIANSAGQPYETGLTSARFIPVWEFAQFESASVSDEDIIERNEAVNSVAFRGRAAKSLQLTVQSSVLGFYFNQRRRLTTYALRYNSKLWTHKRLDVGTVYKSGSDLLAYTDEDGNVILGALDGSGGKQPAGTAPAINEFDQFEELDFSTFLRT